MRSLLAIPLLFAACGDDAPATPDAPPAADAPPDTPAGPTYADVAITQSFTETSDTTYHYARFLPNLPPTRRVVDNCEVFTDLLAPNPPQVSAGQLTFSTAGNTITVNPAGGANYGALATNHVYAPGQQITIAATGSVVPAFSQMVQFPSDVVVTPPVVDRDGFTVTWTGTADVTVALLQPPNALVTCTFSGVTTGAIPAAALVDLQPGATMDKRINVQIGSEAKAQVTAGPFAFAVRAVNISYVEDQFAPD